MTTVGPSRSPVLVRHWTLQAAPGSVPKAREGVRQECSSWGLEPARIHDVELVAAELVTNAVLHGSGPLLLTLRLGAGHVYVGVTDRSPQARPNPSAADPVTESGHGLVVVEALASGWGSEPLVPRSKLVWATIPVQPSRRPDTGNA